MIVRFVRHTKRVLIPLKPEIKKVVDGVIDGVIDESVKEWVEHTKPPRDIETVVRNYCDYLKEHTDKLVNERIDEMLEG